MQPKMQKPIPFDSTFYTLLCHKRVGMKKGCEIYDKRCENKIHFNIIKVNIFF
jgi:hypothetical protein